MKAFYYLGIVVLIVGLLYYDDVVRSDVRFQLDDYLENPSLYGDRQEEFFGQIVSLNEEDFVFDVGGQEIVVKGSIEQSVLGETSLFLDFKPDGSIVLIDYHNYNYNYVLYGLSVLALIIFVVLFFKEWKITRRGIESA